MKIARIILLIGGIMGLVLCLGMGAVAAYLFQAHSWKPGTFATVTGHVIRMDRQETGTEHGSGTVYHPVVQYQREDGSRHMVRGQVGSEPLRYQVGDAVPVQYLKQNPSTARLDTSTEKYFLPSQFLFLSIFGFVCGANSIVLALCLPMFVKRAREKLRKR